ncbi:hypothetical protein ACFQQB_24270 [Nonomuraea rubra]
MRTVIVRLVEPEQSGGQLRGLLEEVGANRCRSAARKPSSTCCCPPPG